MNFRDGVCVLRRFAFGMSLAALLNPSIASAEIWALVGGTLVDSMRSEPLADAVLVIDDGRILAVGRNGDVSIPRDAAVVDATGKFIIPGLMDANVHLGLSHNLSLEAVLRYEGRFDEIILEAAQFALKGGVTTVFDTWGPLPELIHVRDDVNAGRSVGSRIFVGGNVIGSNGVFNGRFLAPGAEDHVSDEFRKRTDERYQQGVGIGLQLMRPDELRRAVEQYITKDVDLLKYMADIALSVGSEYANPLLFSPRLQRQIIETGHRAGLSVQAHVTSEEAVNVAVDVGLDILTHGELAFPPKVYAEETWQRVAQGGVAASVLPFTERRFAALVSYEEAHGVSLPYTGIYRASQVNRRNMIAAGVKLLLSTDAHLKNRHLPELTPWEVDIVDSDRAIGEAHFNALVALEEDGMSPMSILRAATINIAEAYGVDEDLGSLQVGKIADLVVLAENPLLSAYNYRKISSVYKQGELVDLDALPEAPLITSGHIERAP
jgi:imidazolonepropionase-like amidohydrolase